MGNILLVGATGWHELPGVVGWACVPVLLILLCHLWILLARREHFVVEKDPGGQERGPKP